MNGPERERMEREAAGWAARMDAGAWSDAMEAELERWLAGDPRRHGALLEAQAAWMTIDDADVLTIPAPPGARPEPRFSRRWLVGAGGGLIAASLGGGLWLLGRDARYATEIGEIRRVPLGDGSIAAINTASRISVRLAEARREVRLEAGEAWFQVARDRTRPFVVEAGPVRVQAVGTAFSVRRGADGADVMVTEGVVEAWASGAEPRRIRIAAGERAFIADNAAVRRAPAASSSIDRTLAWRNGKIDLGDRTVGEAVAEFNRYNRRQLVIVDPALAEEQLAGVFRTDDPEGFAIAIRGTLDLPVDLSDAGEIRLGR